MDAPGARRRPTGPAPKERPLTALPSPLARALAFAGIIVAGLLGGVIGWAVADLQCTGSCAVLTTVGSIAGALVAALGTAVLAVLVLRAMGEWRSIELERKEAEHRRRLIMGSTPEGSPRAEP